MEKADFSVADGGFASPEEARDFADRLVSACVTSKRLVQKVIAEALMEVQQAVERKFTEQIEMACADAESVGYYGNQLDSAIACFCDHIAALEAAKVELIKENRRARVQVPLWKGVAAAMVERAKRIRCQFGGDHSMADCRCDPHQLGDAVFTMQDEWDRATADSIVSEHSGLASQGQESDCD